MIGNVYKWPDKFYRESIEKNSMFTLSNINPFLSVNLYPEI